MYSSQSEDGLAPKKIPGKLPVFPGKMIKVCMGRRANKSVTVKNNLNIS